MIDPDEKTKRSLIKAAQKSLTASGKDISQLVSDMFSSAAAEDLVEYTSDELAEFAKDCWDSLSDHQIGTHKIRIFNPNLATDGAAHKDVTVVEITNDNMPFLVDSVMGAVQSCGYPMSLVLHPVLHIGRGKKGNVDHYYGTSTPEGVRGVRKESLIQLHIERLDSRQEIDQLMDELDLVLKDVRHAVADWQKMRLRLTEATLNFKSSPPPVPVDGLAEGIQFLEWLGNDNFTFLGMRDYVFEGGVDSGELARQTESGLGILRDPDVRVLRRGKELVVMTPEIREFMLRPEPLIITKANVKSRVHRPVHMDYIGVKQFDEEGILIGELRIIGLFGSTTYTESTKTVPYLRRKVDGVLTKSGFDPDGHSGRALMNVLEGYPRDELFQIDIDTLTRFAEAILRLDERPRIRVLPRRDKFNRFVSVMVFVPRDRYTTGVRLGIGQYLAKVYEGRLSAWYVTYPEGPLARVHFIIGHDEGEMPDPSRADLEREVSSIVRTWQDSLRYVLRQSLDAEKARLLGEKYANAFQAGYIEQFGSESALDDIKIIEKLGRGRDTRITFYRRPDENDHRVSLKVIHAEWPIPLSERVPMLENMGFRVINERTYQITPFEGTASYLHDMTLETASGAPMAYSSEEFDRLRMLFLAVWYDRAEDDGYNALALHAKIAWRDIAMIRSVSRYLRQAGIFYSESFMSEALCRNPKIAVALVDIFHLRFSIDEGKGDRSLKAARTLEEINAALESVDSIDDDRILRRFLNVIESVLRTNFFQLDSEGQPKPTFSFKLNPRNIDELPAPRPYREIFVYSPRLEGVHLRFGKVARGGLRWSDRAQDFRTEVLGLVKAQQVKNAVIVPVGAKGGFVPKKLPVGGSREDVFTEGTEAYKIFISSLLDVTDNLDGEKVVPPEMVVRRDDDDAYLVVAADKGTATFSDTANAISEGRDFWLGDAFASGGSAGYDHKKMGITARGGWEAVKRHFREMDRDIQKEPFTAAGVGDMSGDVFGNGMLLSKKTRLVAAFDHRDIFIDPNPNADKTWPERKRLFDMGRSSWQDYNKSYLSKGGAIFSRSEKSLTLSPEIQKLLQIDKSKTTPNEVMTAILRMETDLLWFGGIGTYIRASTESDAEAGDRANDAIRVTPQQLKCKVIGEGANLGITQKARMEFSRLGGRCNSDAIDNSAGVNSSDLEVNIKIALGAAVRSKKLDTPARNKLLADMTDNVAGLVLRNNYLQTLSISLAERRGIEAFSYQKRMMQHLEKRQLLDREVEFLPDDITLSEMELAGQTLTRPEIGVLLAYAKLTLYDDLLETTVPDDPYFEVELISYFPDMMKENYKSEITGHRLRREIIATQIANHMINRGGPTFITRIGDQTGAKSDETALAFTAATAAFALEELYAGIDKLDNSVTGDMQLELYQRLQEAVFEQTVWFLRNVTSSEGVAATIDRFKSGIQTLSPKMLDLTISSIKERTAEQIKRYSDAGVPGELAEKIARLPLDLSIPDAVLVSERASKPLDKVATIFFKVADHFRIGRIDTLARNLAVVDYYDGLALDRARSMLASAHRQIAAEVLSKGTTQKGFDDWLKMKGIEAERTISAVNEITESDVLTVSKLSVAASLLADLAST
ncbi:MAG: NAD-glutamate dehydrogenase [Stappiaceae bacterium]